MSNRASTAERGYGREHRKLRAALLARWRPGDPCARCGRGMWHKALIDLGHVDGDRTRYAGLEHRWCNRGAPRRGKRFPWERQARRRPPPRSW
jgi:hypothetical protein